MKCPKCGYEIPESDDDDEEEQLKIKLPSTLAHLPRGLG